MKKTICILFFIFFQIATCYCQYIKVQPKFISFKQSRFSLGAGFEAGFLINSSAPAGVNVIYKDPRDGSNTLPYSSFGLVYDLYSANSVIGILGGADYSTSSFGLQEPSQLTDFFTISKIELPLYLKLRLGASNRRKHFWILLGGVYNINQTCKREQFDASLGTNTYTTITDNDKNQVQNYFAVGSALGYEFFVDKYKHFRIAFYARGIYPLKSELNNNYPEFRSGGNGIMANYSAPDIINYRVTFGIKFMFQFGEAIGFIANAALKNGK